MSEQNPFAVPEFAAAPEIELRSYGGLRRAPYAGYSILIAFVQCMSLGVVVSIWSPRGPSLVTRHLFWLCLFWFCLVVMLGGLIAHLFVGARRLHNLGYSGLWLLGLLVPWLNILVGLGMIALPEGYADHKTLDWPATVLIGGGLLVLIAIVFFQ